jgi:VanZ family protein
MARGDHTTGVLARFAPPLGLMAVIYALSAQPDLNSGLGTVDFVGRKIVHMGEYGLLWFLWHRALHQRHPGWAAAIAVGYAMTDEFHQTFVHGREGTPRDVLIDAAGVAIAYALWRRHSRRGAARRA